jgi:TATA-box binding protein (TBP) (component of TFIID and TFIIIB)
MNVFDFGKGPCIFNNMVCSFNLGPNLILNLRKIGLDFRETFPFSYNKPTFTAANINMEGKPAINEWYCNNYEKEQWYHDLAGDEELRQSIVEKFAMEEMNHKFNGYGKIIEMKVPWFPSVAFLIFTTGKVVQSGAFTPEHAEYAAIQFSIYVNKYLHIPVKVQDFTIANIVMSIKCDNMLDLYGIAKKLKSTAVYDPMRFPAVRISGVDNPKQKILVYRKGAMVSCGCSTMSEIKKKYFEMYEIAEKYIDRKYHKMSHKEYRLKASKKIQKHANRLLLNEKLQLKANPNALSENGKRLLHSKNNLIETLLLDFGSSSILTSSNLDNIKQLTNEFKKDEEDDNNELAAEDEEQEIENIHVKYLEQNNAADTNNESENEEEEVDANNDYNNYISEYEEEGEEEEEDDDDNELYEDE